MLPSSLFALALLALLPLSLSQTILRKMADAPWAERSEASAYHNAFPQSILSSTSGRLLVPTGSLWVYGGLDDQDAGYSDVWVSTDSAKTWHEVTGTPSDFVVQDMSRTADCYSHVTGRVYALTGSDLVAKTGRSARIAASNDGQHWEILNDDAGFPVRERPACTVDSQGWVYIFGGSTYNPTTNANGPSNDVWISKDLGYTWTRQTARAPWYMRISADAQTYRSEALGGVDVIYIANGDGGTGHFQNDVWVSSDSARSWAKVATAPYPYRKDAELTISKDGVLIVTSGDDDEANVNDVWASLDGGYTWSVAPPPIPTPSLSLTHLPHPAHPHQPRLG